MTEYSNGHLIRKAGIVLQPFKPSIVTLKLKHRATMQGFIDRCEDLYRKTKENPVKLSK